jgi:hypothetical protein
MQAVALLHCTTMKTRQYVAPRTLVADALAAKPAPMKKRVAWISSAKERLKGMTNTEWAFGDEGIPRQCLRIVD